MPLITITPSTVAVLRRAATFHFLAFTFAPQHADPFVSLAQAAEELDAPASVELAASNALYGALGADDAALAFAAAIDDQMRRRLDLDLWLADTRMGR